MDESSPFWRRIRGLFMFQHANNSSVELLNGSKALQGRLDLWKHAYLNPELVNQTPRVTLDQPVKSLQPAKGDFHVAFPFTLRPAISSGGVDIRLQLLTLRIGDLDDARHRQHRSSQQSSSSSERQRRQIPDVLKHADRAAGLLFARLLFPNSTQSMLDAVTYCWASSTIASTILNYTPSINKALEEFDDNCDDECWQNQIRRALHLGQVAVKEYGESVAVLSITGMLWAWIQPSSYQLAQSLAALIPIFAGYNETARACATGRIQDKEGAWHARHKWAAQYCAHLLPTELPDKAPLQSAMDTLQGLCICIGAALYTDTNGQLQAFDTTSGFSFWASARVGSSGRKTAANADVFIQNRQQPTEIVEIQEDSGLITPPLYSPNERKQPFPIADSPIELHRHLNNNPPLSSSSTATSTSGSSYITDNEQQQQELALYGRGDHLHLEQPTSVTFTESIKLGGRALQLLCIFSPFIFLGSTLLLLSSILVKQQQPSSAGGGRNLIAEDDAKEEEESGIIIDDNNRTAQKLRRAAWWLLLHACRLSGASMIKWAQWSSVREDIFPTDFCDVLSELHDQAPVHSYQQTKREVESALGKPLEQLFITFDKKALASGSIAQVHRATMEVDGVVQQVAVKVRHPGVADQIRNDFRLLRPLARLTSRIQSLRSLNLEESVSQFSHTMTAQTDLRVEAAHLRRFYNNFETVKDAIVVPRALIETDSVLVETFEPGKSVSHYIKTPTWLNTHIVALGVDTYLKMLLQDNFVHTDLHCGNILARTVPRAEHAQQALHTQPSQLNQDEHGQGVQIVLLDFGLAEELTDRVRKHFVGFLFCIGRGDGAAAAEHLLNWAVNQKCPNRAAFTQEMVAFFNEKADIKSKSGIDLDVVMKGVLHLARKHEVNIDSNYAALVIGVCVIVGFATSLDKRVNLMDAAVPCFLAFALAGRVSGRLYV